MSQVAITSIQSMLAPVVLMTAASILAGGIQTMFAAVNDRMRAMAAGKLLRLTGPDGVLLETRALALAPSLRVAQLPVLRERHRLLRDALQLCYATVLAVVISMVLVGVSLTIPAPAAGTAALVVLLTATTVLMLGLVLVAVSVRRSVTAVDYEVYAQYKGHKSDTKSVSQFDDRSQVYIDLKIDTH